ncbi:putative Transmembrane protein [Melia azedarach]|uniref:Transmembrane protein n=1 Tax=Melia azedarach TaxID=155640 RepID=A0ACC1WTL9_MELAZ|nr:putative Transmembrane protein [Melia azedarach]
MESSSCSSSISPTSLLYWNYFNLLFIRPVLAISFALSFIILGWILAWKLVLVHVPLIQEIFGLRKKPVKPKPTGLRRYSKIYKEINTAKSITE